MFENLLALRQAPDEPSAVAAAVGALVRGGMMPDEALRPAPATAVGARGRGGRGRARGRPAGYHHSLLGRSVIRSGFLRRQRDADRQCAEVLRVTVQPSQAMKCVTNTFGVTTFATGRQRTVMVEGERIDFRLLSHPGDGSVVLNAQCRGCVSHQAAQAAGLAKFIGAASDGDAEAVFSTLMYDDASMWVRAPRDDNSIARQKSVSNKVRRAVRQREKTYMCLC